MVRYGVVSRAQPKPSPPLHNSHPALPKARRSYGYKLSHVSTYCLVPYLGIRGVYMQLDGSCKAKTMNQLESLELAKETDQ